MNNKCPKCSAKLSPFYLKPNCPKCGVNIMQYGFDDRIENDRLKAEREWDKFDNFLSGINKSTIGSPVAIIRLVSFFLPVAVLLSPVYKINGSGMNLISIIKSIITDFSSVFQNKAMLLCFISFAAVILLSLVCAVVSVFSFTENGYKRNMVFGVLQTTVFAALSIVAVINGARVFVGAVLVILLELLTLFLHKKHKEHFEESK